MPRKQQDRSLSPADLRATRAALARARGKERLDLILGSRDPEALVRSLPADDLYLTIREIGFGDGAALVPLSSPEQLKIFIDLDAWPGGRLDPRRALPWLRAARAGAQRDEAAAGRWQQKLEAIDPEILSLVLASTVYLHDLERDPDPVIRGDRFLHTPEGKYVIEFLVDGVEYAAVRGLIDDLYAEDPFRATRLIAAIRWDLPSELEESELRWRAGRLADLGFPSLEEALSWFARPPRAPGRPAGAPERPPGYFLVSLARGSLLDRAIASLGGEERDGVEVQIVSAANAVLVADGVDPGDPEQVRAAFEAARGYLELGLERLSGGEDARAREVLASTPVKRVFQEGFGRVLELRWRAERILASAGGKERLDSPLRELLEALASRRPRYFPGIEAPREDWGTPLAGAYQPRHFRDAHDLARAGEALDEAERQGAAPAAT